jgi:hypothetical protein
MSDAFVWPPRHAPGYPPGCADTGDVLAHFATRIRATATMVVVTSALRASVEDSADHDTGLDRVRDSLVAIGRSLGEGWSPSYYGKDLVLVREGADTDSPDLSAVLKASPGGVRHGWAWAHVAPRANSERQRAELLATCYVVSMAARFRRDRPSVGPSRAEDALARVPAVLSASQRASLLAGVLVRPFGAVARVWGTGPGDDPRLPGVPSADGWASHMADPPANGLYAVTDVHDIEWGTLRRGPDRTRLTYGNAQRLLSLAETWGDRSTSHAEVLGEAYRARLARESALTGHLRAMSEVIAGEGELFATLGDGMSGTVSHAAALRSALIAADGVTPGELSSGAGAADIAQGGIEIARGRAYFSLHVTKTLKGTDHPQGRLHVFDEPLDAETARSAIDFLVSLQDAADGTPGLHHLAHAVQWQEWWRLHLPRSERPRLSRLVAQYGERGPG